MLKRKQLCERKIIALVLEKMSERGRERDREGGREIERGESKKRVSWNREFVKILMVASQRRVDGRSRLKVWEREEKRERREEREERERREERKKKMNTKRWEERQRETEGREREKQREGCTHEGPLMISQSCGKRRRSRRTRRCSTWSPEYRRRVPGNERTSDFFNFRCTYVLFGRPKCSSFVDRIIWSNDWK